MARDPAECLVAPIPSEDPKKKDDKLKGTQLNGKDVANKLNDQKNQLHELVSASFIRSSLHVPH